MINGVFISCTYNWLNTNQIDKSKNIDKGNCFISINLFIWYISDQICYSGRGYIEMNVTNVNINENWQV